MTIIDIRKNKTVTAIQMKYSSDFWLNKEHVKAYSNSVHISDTHAPIYNCVCKILRLG